MQILSTSKNTENEPGLDIGGVDTAENGPFKLWGFLARVGGVISLGRTSKIRKDRQTASTIRTSGDSPFPKQNSAKNNKKKLFVF